LVFLPGIVGVQAIDEGYESCKRGGNLQLEEGEATPSILGAEQDLDLDRSFPQSDVEAANNFMAGDFGFFLIDGWMTSEPALVGGFSSLGGPGSSLGWCKAKRHARYEPKQAQQA
jgi:hypothetical protein